MPLTLEENWYAGLKDCEVFMIFASKDDHFEYARTWLQIMFASEMDKPVRVVIKRGVAIPDGYFEEFDIKDLKIKHFSNEQELSLITRDDEFFGSEGNNNG